MTKSILKKCEENPIAKDIISTIQEMIVNHQNTTWLKTNEATKYLNCNNSTLVNLRNQGILPFYKLGGTVYYKRADIDTIIEKTKTTH
jgi:excisionase family DNA binding protein